MRQRNWEKALGENLISLGVDRESCRIIREYFRRYMIERDLKIDSSYSVAYIYMRILTKLRKPLPEITNDDVLSIVEEVRGEFGTNHTRKIIAYLKPLCHYLIDEGINIHLKKERIEAIQSPKQGLLTKKPSEILTRDEVKKIIDAAGSIRDKALLGVLYEGALRSVEAISLTWKDVNFDDNGVVLFTHEKTGVERRIRIVEYAQYLSMWRAVYPGSPEGKSPVFTTSVGKVKDLEYESVVTILQKAVKLSGIKKRTHLHLLRHSRITHLLERGVSETSVKKMAWGKINTPMIAVYAHVSDKHVDSEILAAAGVHKEKKREEEKANICPGCQVICPPGSEYCPKCGTGLTEQARERRITIDKTIESTQLWENMVKKMLPAMVEAEVQKRLARAG